MDEVEELIRAARAGQRTALESLLARYLPFIRLVVRCQGRRLGLAGDALAARVDDSDIVQETLLKATQSIGQFAGTAEPQWRAWLRTTAEREGYRQMRLHLDADRRAVAREVRPAADDSLTGSRPLDDWLARTLTTPSLAAIRGERAAWLGETLAMLPDDYREVLVWRHLEGLEFPEIGARMDRSAGAVRVLWVRALKRLRQVATERGDLSA
jgi:RNA polymerase sigma-70 factor (ECF subfamily)